MLGKLKHVASSIRRRLTNKEVFETHRQVLDLERSVGRLVQDLERVRRDLRYIDRSVNPRAEPILPPIKEDGFRFDEIFLLGSGSSILELTESQKNQIRAGASVSMNRYVIFWELVGIWPSLHFLADSRGVGRQVFRRSLEIIRENDPADRPTLLLESEFELLTPRDLPGVFFYRDDRRGSNCEFADSLEDPLFFHRGSLTSLLNLVSILRLAPKVRLIGVDLNRPGTFFEEMSRRPEYAQYFNDWDERAKSQGVHATVANMSASGWGSGTILDKFDVLLGELRERGISCTCTSPESLLVESGLCDVEALVGFDESCRRSSKLS